MDKRIAIFTILMLFVFSFIYSNDILNKSEREYIDNKGVIIFVGDTNYPPFYFVNKNNDIDGMTVELLRWIATELKLNIEFIHMPLSDGREAIQSGEADILCDFFYSINRDSTFDFTIPICDVPAYIYVKADRTDIKDINDLSGKIVSMQKGDYAYKFLQLKGIDFKILFTEDFSKAINLLINGESDAVIGDEQVIMYYVYSHNIYEKIKKIGYKLYDGKSSLAGKEGEAVLVDILSKGIILAQKTGTLDKIAEKWLGKTYEHHVNIFRKYLFISLIILSLILIVFLITWYTNLILRKNIKIRTKELEIQTTYFKGLFENSPEAIIIVDNMDRIIDINNAFKEMFGYKLKEIRNQFINNFIVPEDFKEEASNLSLESLNGNILRKESKRKKKDGTLIDVIIIAAPIKLREKQIGVYGMYIDISQRKQLENKIRDEKDKLTNFLKSIADGILVIDESKHIIMVNRTAEEITGYGSEEIIGKNIFKIVKFTDKEIENKLKDIINCIITKNAFSDIPNNIRISDKDGIEHILDINIAPTYNINSEIIGVNVILRDITERYSLEQELDKVERLNTIGLLAGGIAHDFNNFLTTIMGNISIVTMHLIKGDKLYNYLKLAEKAAINAKHVTNQLLTFAEGGAPVKKVVNLDHIFEEVKKIALAGSNIKLVYSSRKDLWKVEVDKEQIMEAMNSIFINAKEAMPGGGIINVLIENVSNIPREINLEPGKYIKIAIEDHGGGIPEGDLAKIFDPYFSTKEKGTGLGLTTAFSIIKSHHGTINIESNVGKGTTVIIYLPAFLDMNDEDIDEKTNFAKNLNILVMDDEELVGETVIEMIKTLGHKADLATDGSIAIEKYQKSINTGNKYDMVILDLTIPGGMGGKETIKKLLDIDPDINAIVSSGYSNDPIIAHYEQYGFKGVISKPYRIRELNQTLIQISNK